MNATIAPAGPGTEEKRSVMPARVPQVNLLPPDVAAAQGLRAVKRWAALAVASSVLLVGLVYLVSAIELGDARDELTAEQARSTQLQAQMAEYSEVPLVLGELRQVELARSLGTSTEVLWRPYVDALRAALPAGATIESLQVSGATPMVSALTPADPLQEQSLGTLIFTAKASALPDTTAWVDALAAVPGLAYPRLQSAVVEDTEDALTYLVTGTVQYDEDALSGRFQAGEGNE